LIFVVSTTESDHLERLISESTLKHSLKTELFDIAYRKREHSA